jgi:hypothetical protein
MKNSISICGATDTSGSRYLVFTQADKSVCVPMSVVNKGNAAIRTSLSEGGILIGGEQMAKSVFARLAEAYSFDDCEIASKVGWNASYFALPNGTVYGHQGRRSMPVAYRPHPKGTSTAGSLKKWRKLVAKRLTSQPIPMISIMAMFAPPIMRLVGRQENFGFELVGPRGAGKSTLHKVAASVVGPIGQAEQHTSIMSAQHIMSSCDEVMRQHSDMPIVADGFDALPVDGRPSSLGKMHSILVTKLVHGIPGTKIGQSPQECHKLGFSYSGNAPLGQVLNQPQSDGLITILVDGERPYGVFEDVPVDLGNGASFAHELVGAAEANCGWAFDTFVRRLVQEHGADAGKLSRRLQGWVDQFIDKAKVDRNDGRLFRNAEAFGIVYAAGRLAQEYKVLPKSWEPGPAAMAIYEAQRFESLSPPVEFQDRLLAIIADDRVASGKANAFLPKGKLAIVRPALHGGQELIVPKSNIEKLLPDWRLLKRSGVIDGFVVKEDDRMTTKRQISKNKNRERVICLRLPWVE